MSDKILVIDDDPKIRKFFDFAFDQENIDISIAESAINGLQMISEEQFDLVLLDIVMPEMDGMEALTRIKEIKPDLMVVMITGHPQYDIAVNAIKQGAYDFIPKPFSLDEIRIVVRRSLDHSKAVAENIELKRKLNYRYHSSEIIGTSPEMLKIFQLIDSIEDIDCTILIEGESGTGKDVIARAIHDNSRRYKGPFISINCGAIPETLLESELFGHNKGAFTGAVASKRGLFEIANNGTVFLDEISETSSAMQVKLLRIIEEGCFRRVGSTTDIKLDVRLISATNKVLKEEVEKNKFRADLFYRLDVISISLPPLRERIQDIPLLVDHYIKRFNSKYFKHIEGIDDESMELLKIYEFPGNIRELKNIIERAVVISKDNLLQKDQIEKAIRKKSDTPDDFSLEQSEKRQIIKVLNRSQYNKSKTATILGIDRKTLYKKLKKYHII